MTTKKHSPSVLFLGKDEVPWTVWEDPGVPHSLIFDCCMMTRRVREYPDDWHRLDRVALMALSWKT